MLADNTHKRIIDDPITEVDVIADAFIAFNAENIDELQTAATPLKGKISNNPKTAAVILAGGSGERFGSPNGKQLTEILGKPALTWSAEAFDAVEDIGLIILVCPEEQMDEFCRQAVDPFPFVTPIIFVPSGIIRQQSSSYGVSAVPSNYELIAIHDGARPLTSPEMIGHAISLIKGNPDFDGAVVGYHAIDTLKVVNSDKIVGTPDRDAFFIAQTPQVFQAESIREAHRQALAEGFVGTDDSSLVERIGGVVSTVRGSRCNIKITVPEDIFSAEAILKNMK